MAIEAGLKIGKIYLNKFGTKYKIITEDELKKVKPEAYEAYMRYYKDKEFNVIGISYSEWQNFNSIGKTSVIESLFELVSEVEIISEKEKGMNQANQANSKYSKIIGLRDGEFVVTIQTNSEDIVSVKFNEDELMFDGVGSLRELSDLILAVLKLHDS